MSDMSSGCQGSLTRINKLFVKKIFFCKKLIICKTLKRKGRVLLIGFIINWKMLYYKPFISNLQYTSANSSAQGTNNFFSNWFGIRSSGCLLWSEHKRLFGTFNCFGQALCYVISYTILLKKTIIIVSITRPIDRLEYFLFFLFL